VAIAETETQRPGSTRELRLDKFRLGLAAVVILSTAWSWYCIARGWYLQADFANLLDAHRASLSWHYLSSPLGGHFGPVGRLMYWLLDRLAPMSYDATVAVRLLMQALATALLYRVVLRISGRSTLALILTALFSVNPLLIVSLAWLSSGLTLPLAEILILLAIELHLRRGHVGSIRDALVAGALLAVAVLANDGAAVATLILPILSFGCLLDGSFVDRCRQAVRDWAGWLALALPVAISIGLALSFADDAGAQALTFSDAWHLINYDWTHALAPTLIGGPWRWYAGTSVYLPFTAPSDAVVVIGQVVAALVLVVAVQRFGWRVLNAVAVVGAVAIAEILFAGIGRYATYSNLIAITPRYSDFVPLAMAIGIAAVTAQTPETSAHELPAAVTRLPSSTAARLETERSVLVGCLVGVLVISNMLSVARFADIWSTNPGRNYVGNLVRSARAVGPSVNVYDTPVRGDVLSGLEPEHYVSDLLALENVPANVDSPISDPLIVKPNGQLVHAAFVSAGNAKGPTKPQCGTYLSGAGTWKLTFDKPVNPGEWFLRLELYQAQPSVISIQVVNRDGTASAPVTGARISLTKLEELNLRMPVVAPVAVRITTMSASTSLCLTRVSVGAPFPVS
jgi:hypothetical protein